ncbi:type I-E CRISPR-associated protein Cas5/CasD [Actinosynnema sp. NPDC050436]|uniref:type I-E CRISPR-associated protein Cas5/CasD n=1 Tax=Actinosynnema sp. NPDC050436 TaxID=3155659 RepID=UPI0033D9700E
MNGVLLHLSGPLQSWGGDSPWNRRDTGRYPTRSGLLGMIGAIVGHGRDESLAELDSLRFTIRIDRPGQPVMDYQTVGGGRPHKQTPLLASHSFRPAGKGTLVSERFYLSDAAFTVAVTGDGVLVDRLSRMLARPVYAPYLGRRSCPPAGLLVLGRHDDPVHALSETVPLARKAPRHADTVAVDFITESPPTGDVFGTREVSNTQPLTNFRSREFDRHTRWRTTRRLAAQMCGGVGLDYLDRLATGTAEEPHDDGHPEESS